MTKAQAMQAVLDHADAHMDESLARLIDLVRIPSVSTVVAGKERYSIMEQVLARLSCAIHGVIGGYTDPGFKTVIAARATARLSFRPVAGQDPLGIRKALRTHIRTHVPAECSVCFTSHGARPAICLPLDSPYLAATHAALSHEPGTKTALARTGGSIPIVAAFKCQPGMETLLLGFARFYNRIRSPNEQYHLSSVRGGIRSFVRVRAALSETEGTVAP